MSRKQETRWNLEELTDADICAVIQYLDPDLIPKTNDGSDFVLFVICLSFLIMVLGCAALLWLYCPVLGR
jgi:hypothetical protein